MKLIYESIGKFKNEGSGKMTYKNAAEGPKKQLFS